MTEPHAEKVIGWVWATDEPTPILSQAREMVQKYREASGCEGKYLRGHPSLAAVGQLAAAEFGLEWQSDPQMPPGVLMVAGDG